MTVTEVASGSNRVSDAGMGDASLWRRLPASLLLLAAGLWFLLAANTVRGLEARGTAAIIGFATSSTTSVYPGRATFYWDLYTPKVYGLVVTPQCTVAYTGGPLLLVVALVALLRRLPPSRVLAGSLAALTVIITCNLARLTLIAWSIHRFGERAGLWWSHVLIGSLLTIGSLGLALACIVRIAFRPTSARCASAAPARRVPPTTKESKEHNP